MWPAEGRAVGAGGSPFFHGHTTQASDFLSLLRGLKASSVKWAKAWSWIWVPVG